jgi:flagellar export protein FliJ
MAFDFSLATLLRVRGIVEEREEGVLQKILFDISTIHEDLRRTDALLAESNASRHADIFKPCIGLQVHASYGQVNELKRHRENLARQIQKLEQARDAQIILYRAARRDREMITDMLEKQRIAHDKGVNLREQKALDDNYNVRRGRA